MEVEQREYLRNRIAILTMTHLLKGTPHPWAMDDMDNIASHAYAMADAMLKAEEVGNEKV